MPVKSEPRERPFIKMFVSGYDGGSWKDAVPDWVEEQLDGAVEVIATRADGTTLAIEHTIVQPFVGEKRDSVEFLEAFGRIDKNPDLVLPERLLTVSVPVGAIPKGYDRDEVGNGLLAWLKENHHTVPIEGYVERDVILCDKSKLGPLSLVVGFHTMHLPGMEGSTLIARRSIPKNFGNVVAEALSRKLPKLVKTQSDRRILLLEPQHISMSETQIREQLEAQTPSFPELAQVNEIWLVDTAILESDNFVWFSRLGRGPVEQLRFTGGVLKHRRDDRFGIDEPV